MKGYFPLTDYDFYAYLTAGAGILISSDYFLGTAFVPNGDMAVVEGFILLGGCYILGQAIASLSSLTLETWLFRFVLTKPIDLQLLSKEPNLTERLIGHFVGRYYGALPCQMVEKIFSNVNVQLANRTPGDTEYIFQSAFQSAKRDNDTVARRDSFINQYGFCRNLTFVLICSILMCLFAPEASGANKTLQELVVLVPLSIIFFFATSSFMRTTAQKFSERCSRRIKQYET